MISQLLTVQIVLAGLPEVLPREGVEQAPRGAGREYLSVQCDVPHQHPSKHLALIFTRRASVQRAGHV